MAASGETVLELIARAAGSPGRGGVFTAHEGQFCFVSWQDVVALACRGADELAKRGIEPGDRVAIAATNSLEWIVADLAIQMLGCVVVPLHVSLSGQQLAWQLEHSDTRLLVADDEMQRKVVAVGERTSHRTKHVPWKSWAQSLAAGNEANGRALWRKTLDTTSPNTLASIVYTSGTSGEPRGVMLTHGNLAANARGVCDGFAGLGDDCRLNALPFSHAYARMSDLYVSLAGQTRLGLCRQRDSLVADAQAVQPTLLVVVPLQLARIRAAAVANYGENDNSAVRKLLGGRIRGLICGGAPLASELHDYFTLQSTPVWEGYGLTEAAPVVTLSSEHAWKRHSVGRAVPGTELRLADDGELLVRGPQVMAGYWNDQQATVEVLRDGWLHTGDLATIDSTGYVFLHGRKKEFIALASGKKVWPAAIESRFADDPRIAQILIVGEGRSALGALVVLRPGSQQPLPGVDELNSVAGRKAMLDYLASRLTDAAAEQQIRHVWIVAEPWTAEREELTPKLTLRRSVITARYAGAIRRMFGEAD